MGKLTIDDEPDAVGGLFGHGFGIAIVDEDGNTIQTILSREHLEAGKRCILNDTSLPAPQPYKDILHPEEVMAKHTHKPKKKPKKDMATWNRSLETVKVLGVVKDD